VGAVYLTHPAATEQRHHIVWTEFATRSQSHDPIDYTGIACSAQSFDACVRARDPVGLKPIADTAVDWSVSESDREPALCSPWRTDSDTTCVQQSASKQMPMKRTPRKHRQHTTARPGTVVLSAAELGRYTVAQQCFDALQLPAGTARLRHAGRSNVADNRNAMAESFAGDWLAMIDDDHVYTPDMLLRLLRHLERPDVDIVTPLIVRRTLPHQNVLVTAAADAAKPHETRQVVLQPSDKGLLEVHAAGTGVMVLKRRVFDRISRPWFEWGRTSEDFALCLKAQAAGCRIFCDLETRVGHILPMIVWPGRAADGRFVPMYSHFVSTGPAAITLGAVTRSHDETDLRPKAGPGRPRRNLRRMRSPVSD
jgi:hypothetical protein